MPAIEPDPIDRPVDVTVESELPEGTVLLIKPRYSVFREEVVPPLLALVLMLAFGFGCKLIIDWSTSLGMSYLYACTNELLPRGWAHDLPSCFENGNDMQGLMSIIMTLLLSLLCAIVWMYVNLLVRDWMHPFTMVQYFTNLRPARIVGFYLLGVFVTLLADVYFLHGAFSTVLTNVF
jgi:hypothetical protein